MTDIYFPVRTFGELTRKIWSAKAYKGHVSPHEFLQAIHSASGKKFFLGTLKDPQEFLTWLMNSLVMIDPEMKEDLATQILKKSKLAPTSLVTEFFQGILEVRTQQVMDERMQVDGEKNEPKLKLLHFFHLPLELPPIPLFQTTQLVPEVSLESLLLKYNLGVPQEKGKSIVTYRFKKCPQYLILYIKRFIHGKFKDEKNPTVVNFPFNKLELKEYHYLKGPNEKSIFTEKSIDYKLIANICHEGGGILATEGSYKVQLLNKANRQWYEIQDLLVKEILPQLLFLSESYIQVLLA